MGFPTIYYCVILPTPLVVLLQILDLIRLSLSTALAFLGVRCPMLELPALPPPPADDAAGAADAFAYDRLYPLSDIPASPSPQLPSPASIKRRLPVVRFAALRLSAAAAPSGGADDAGPACCCPICLCGLEARHQVRLLDNCRHVFHKGCLDRWVDQGQSTCPLCRSRLLTQARSREPRARREQQPSGGWLAGSAASLLRGPDDTAATASSPPSPPQLVRRNGP